MPPRPLYHGGARKTIRARSGVSAQTGAVVRYVRFDVGLGGDGKWEKIYIYSILRIADESTETTTLCR